MKSWKKPTSELIDKALGSFKKEHHRKYFFSRLENPLWLKPLAERGCFKHPPKAQRFDDGTVQFPYWPEIQYLKNVCSKKPHEVISLVLDLPDTDNSVVYDGILDIALQLPSEHSVKLKDKILHYTSMERQFGTHRYANLLERWTKENQTAAALELAKILIKFAPNRQSEAKRKQRSDNADDWREMIGTSLYPVSKYSHWEYSNIMSKGVRPLAEKEPFKTSCLLFDTLVDMIHLRTHKEDLNNEKDHSNIWCPRLYPQDDKHENPERILVHTLAYSCANVFEKPHDTVAVLDRVLRKKPWAIFKRLRQHLYGQYPNEQTKPWIRELILTHKDYGLWEHHFEFQQMIRLACEHFKDTLLSEEERIRIFDAILKGPSKENYRHWIEGWLGEEFTEESFKERQQRFHWMQLRPFEFVLFGKYETRFRKLQDKINKPISDDNYPPYKTEVRTGGVSDRSPRSPADLSNLTDKELLDFINEWEKDEESYENNSFVRINIEILANAFQTVFKESIIPNPNRLKFWIKNRERIERAIYVRVMIYAMQALVKERNFGQLNEWLTFSEWILSHPDREHDQDYKQGDESRENQNWTNARRAVGDFIGVCLEEDIDVPITAREKLAKILEMLCTQYDWNLDEGNPNRLERKDPLTEGINNTRSRALDNLVQFGSWLRRHESQGEVPEVTTLLEKRFSSEIDYPLTPPEYAILGMYYPSLCSFNEKWAIEHKPNFFPQAENKRQEWYAAFSSFILCNGAVKQMFEILKDDFNFALQHLSDFKKHDLIARQPIDVFGERLFNYYLWEMFPLEGQESLLEQFYQQTDEKREHWANLFNNIGHRLSSTGKDLDQSMKDKIKKFFNWRLKQEVPTELRYFTFWLQAECLETKWRLKSYSKVIDICKAGDCEVENWEIYLKELCQMLPKYTAEVVECFFKLTNDIRNKNIYIQTEEANTILKSGLNSRDPAVSENAKRALNNLLRADKLEFMDLAISKDKQTLEE
ncbi:MAG: hypothetical protein OXU51_19410 [Candidatus Poribacteria bacterium]|nr:hypothetical protein [Candidatus Poribacteria bacterium]